MIPIFVRGLVPVALLAMAMVAPAQSPRPSARPDPLDASAVVPPAVYRTVLAPYRKTADDTPVPWRDANATVARIGGWRAYAREAQGADAAATPNRQDAPRSTP